MGFGHRYAPGTSAESYVVTAPFEDNMLSTDPGMFAYMKDQALAHPELALGGPSLRWLHEALSETRELDRMASPATPTITFLGGNERIVDPTRVVARMERWPNGRLEMIDGAEHEVMMETPAIQARVFDQMAAFFAEHAAVPA
jgi:lysophospholipase